MEQKIKKIQGQKVGEGVWKIDNRKLTPELKKEHREATKEYIKGIGKRYEERRRRTLKSNIELRNFLITY